MTRTALWIGDSFTAGEGAFVPASLTYPFLVSERLGWNCRVDAQSGTGFVNDGWLASPGYAPLIRRLRDDLRHHPADVLIVDAGRNDVEATTPALTAAVTDYLAALRSGYPVAPLAVVLPSLIDREQPPEYHRVAGVLRAAAAEAGGTVIDPAGAGAFRDLPDLNGLTCQDGFHPSAAGQARYAEVLTDLLRRAWP
jgi:lysophospholipase L1-like esterase